MLDYTYKPLDGTFPRPLTPTYSRQDSRFGKTWKQILEDLERELRFLDYRIGSCVIMTAHTPYDVRQDGKLRRDARKPDHPGVVIKFDVWDAKAKRYIPMSFECDNFTSYEANTQAIAGAMEALRKVDRYAVSSRGKAGAHYEGYKTLPSAEGKIGDLDQAVMFVATHSGFHTDDIRSDATARNIAFKKAAQKLHPDAGGNQDEFIKLTDARRFLEQL